MQILTRAHMGRQAPSYIALKRRVSGYEQGWTWTHQAASALDELGLSVTYHTDMNSAHMLAHGVPSHVEGRAVYREKTLPAIARDSMRDCLNRGILREAPPSFEEIAAAFQRGEDACVVIDANVLSHTPGYRGHMVVLFDVDEFAVSFSGFKKPVERIERRSFVEAWQAPGTDRDVLLVRGRK